MVARQDGRMHMRVHLLVPSQPPTSAQIPEWLPGLVGKLSGIRLALALWWYMADRPSGGGGGGTSQPIVAFPVLWRPASAHRMQDSQEMFSCVDPLYNHRYCVSSPLLFKSYAAPA